MARAMPSPRVPSPLRTPPGAWRGPPTPCLRAAATSSPSLRVPVRGAGGRSAYCAAVSVGRLRSAMSARMSSSRSAKLQQSPPCRPVLVAARLVPLAADECLGLGDRVAEGGDDAVRVGLVDDLHRGRRRRCRRRRRHRCDAVTVPRRSGGGPALTNPMTTCLDGIDIRDMMLEPELPGGREGAHRGARTETLTAAHHDNILRTEQPPGLGAEASRIPLRCNSDQVVGQCHCCRATLSGCKGTHRLTNKGAWIILIIPYCIRMLSNDFTLQARVHVRVGILAHVLRRHSSLAASPRRDRRRGRRLAQDGAAIRFG